MLERLCLRRRKSNIEGLLRFFLASFFRVEAVEEVLPEVRQAEDSLDALSRWSEPPHQTWLGGGLTSKALINESRSPTSAETIWAPSASSALAPFPAALRVRPRTFLAIVS